MVFISNEVINELRAKMSSDPATLGKIYKSKKKNSMSATLITTELKNFSMKVGKKLAV